MPMGTKRKRSPSRRRKGASGASMRTKTMKKRKWVVRKRRERTIRMTKRMKNRYQRRRGKRARSMGTPTRKLKSPRREARRASR